jgi:hypothetical protein
MSLKTEFVDLMNCDSDRLEAENHSDAGRRKILYINSIDLQTALGDGVAQDVVAPADFRDRTSAVEVIHYGGVVAVAGRVVAPSLVGVGLAVGVGGGSQVVEVGVE